ncbi:MAG: hypothetical protein ACTHKG_12490 [Nocardioides sp.]
MKFKRTIVALAAGAAVSTAGFASASALGVNAGTIQYGSGNATCDATGVDLSYGLETDDNSVRSIRVENIDPRCTGAKLFLKVDGGATKSADITGTSVTINYSPYLNPATINDVSVWIEG